jgi:hypothetical protein
MRLSQAVLVQFALRLSLHDLVGVIHRLSMSDKV